MNYKIYAIRYAQRDGGTRAEDFYRGDLHDGPHDMAYFMWAIVGDDGSTYVVDAGFTPETSLRRPGSRTVLCDPLEVLSALGVNAAKQKDVLVTHLHYDHIGHYGGFPQARFWVQDEEMAFWTGRYASRAGFKFLIEPSDILGLVALNFDSRVRFVDGAATVAPGITLHRVGGHSAGLQVVRVQTDAGPVVLASDAVHVYESLTHDRPLDLIHSLPEMYGAFDTVTELAGGVENVVPGHDPLVMQRYQPASPDLETYAVEITARNGDHDRSPRP
jgi:glyoxylase-like metal-dependent hydrolase (beta-lactamase superfamily II)